MTNLNELKDRDGGIQYRAPRAAGGEAEAGALTELCEQDGVSEATLLDFIARKQAFTAKCALMYGRTRTEIEHWDARLFGQGEAVKAGGGYSDAQRMAVFSAILTYTYEHPSLPDQFAARWVFNQPWLDDMIGHLTQKQFSERARVTKQRIHTAVDQARGWFTAKGFHLPFRAGEERDHAARTNMKKAYHQRNRK